MRYVYFSGIQQKVFLERIETLQSPSMRTKVITLAEQFRRREWLEVLQTDKARLILQSALSRFLGRTFKIQTTE